MPEEADVAAPSEAAAIESPPPTPRPLEPPAEDPRSAASRLATLLARTRSTPFLIEYLRLRRAMRTA